MSMTDQHLSQTYRMTHPQSTIHYTMCAALVDACSVFIPRSIGECRSQEHSCDREMGMAASLVHRRWRSPSVSWRRAREGRIVASEPQAPELLRRHRPLL